MLRCLALPCLSPCLCGAAVYVDRLRDRFCHYLSAALLATRVGDMCPIKGRFGIGSIGRQKELLRGGLNNDPMLQPLAFIIAVNKICLFSCCRVLGNGWKLCTRRRSDGSRLGCMA